MPVKITRIEPQKNSPERISLYAGDEFIIGISKDTLIRFNIYNGIQLSDESLQEIIIAENNYKLLHAAYNFLSRRPHSVHELRQKLFKKKQDTAGVNKVIESLTEKGYLDDKKFAEAFLHEEIKLRKAGPLLIRTKLFSKGVKAEVIENVMQQYDEELQYENCNAVAEKKIKTLKKDKKQKLIQYLRQKGYEWDIISKSINDLNLGEHDE